MKNIWHIIHDCDDEEGNPTCWASTVNGETIWINETEAGYFEISKDRGIYRTCKTLTAAKRWVAINL